MAPQFITEETEDRYSAIRQLQDAHLDASFTIGAEASNIINVAVQLKSDKSQQAITARRIVDVYLADAATGAAIAGTAPDGGVAIGTNGAILVALVASKMVKVVSNASGAFDLNITHAAGAKTVYVVVVMPNGRQVVSSAVTFA